MLPRSETSEGSQQKNVLIPASRRACARLEGTLSGLATQPESVVESSLAAPGVAQGVSTGTRFTIRSRRQSPRPSAATWCRPNFGISPE